MPDRSILDALDAARAAKSSGNNQAAERYYHHVLARDPGNIEAHLFLGRQLGKQGQHERAKSHFESVLKQDNACADALLGLGNLAYLSADFPGALDMFEKALKVSPQSAPLLNNIALIHRENGNPYRSAELLSNATELAPENPEFVLNLGLAYQDLGEIERALQCFEHALKLEPRYARARFYRGMALLSQGDFMAGWRDYEYRLEMVPPPLPSYPFPRWDGSHNEDKTLLIVGEQGIGDQIMFSSCFEEVIRRFKHSVIYCNPKLRKIFRRSFPQSTVLGGKTDRTDWLAEAPEIDLVVAMGSIPRFIRQSASAFPRHTGYLHADPEKTEKWKKKLRELGSELKVGIAWRGGTPTTRSIIRSIPLENMLPILSVSGAHFISLQHTPCDEELTELRDRHNIDVHHWRESTENFDETAALVMSLDLVIGVQTAVIHLAGALGKPAWALIPVCPEWRYLIHGPTMPWYPTVRLYRQSQFNEWGTAILSVAHDLQKLGRPFPGANGR